MYNTLTTVYSITYNIITYHHLIYGIPYNYLQVYFTSHWATCKIQTGFHISSGYSEAQIASRVWDGQSFGTFYSRHPEAGTIKLIHVGNANCDLIPKRKMATVFMWKGMKSSSTVL